MRLCIKSSQRSCSLRQTIQSYGLCYLSSLSKNHLKIKRKIFKFNFLFKKKLWHFQQDKPGYKAKSMQVWPDTNVPELAFIDCDIFWKTHFAFIGIQHIESIKKCLVTVARFSIDVAHKAMRKLCDFLKKHDKRI